MASKKYTAQEMRDFADAIAADLNDCGHTSVTYRFDDLLPIIQCLRHSAEVGERCEAEIAKLPYPPNADDVYMFKRLNYILRGDARKEIEIGRPPRNCDRPECATTKAAQEVWRKEDGGKTAYYEWLLATSTKGEAK